MRHAKYYIFILLCCFAITSCGFHLRGPVILPSPLHRVYVESKDPYGKLVLNIKQYLRDSHAYIAESPADADTVLEIISETQTDQLLSVGGTQQTRQYNLIYTVTFQVKKPNGVVLLPPQMISDTRPISVQSSQILGGSNEANNLYDQMRRSIVYLLMMRLAAPGNAGRLIHSQPIVTSPE